MSIRPLTRRPSGRLPDGAVDQAIADLARRQGEFTNADLARATGRWRTDVAEWLYRRAKRGRVVRVAWGRYRLVDDRPEMLRGGR